MCNFQTTRGEMNLNSTDTLTFHRASRDSREARTFFSVKSAVATGF
jgi:hypothetical protein